MPATQSPNRNPITLTLTLTFDLVFISELGIVMDYPCAEFGDFSFSRFGFIVWTDRQTESQRRINAILTQLQRVGLIINNLLFAVWKHT